MTDLGPVFERLGLDQYLDAFLGEGFDTWETVLDIQESDLDALNVKLGHRRKLQREIANYRGIPYDRLIGSPHEGAFEITRSTEGSQTPSASVERGGTSGETKRKYRRHPKPDENAPDRPPSAYVIFSNKIREDVKGENLSFTAIAKLVGERWQKLDPAEKEPFEAQASAAKERYNVGLSAYKKTEEYREYSAYAADFKAKHAPAPAESSKRPRLEKGSSGGSGSVQSLETSEAMIGISGHVRIGSVGSMNASSFPQTLPSPIGGPPGLTTQGSNPIFSSTGSRMTSASPQLVSPQSALLPWDTTRSSRSSISEESTFMRSEHSDPLPRATQLSLVTLLASGPGYPSFAAAESLTGPDAHRRSTRYLQQQENPGSVAASSLPPRLMPAGSSMNQQLPSDEFWRSRPQDATSASFRSYPDLTRTAQHPLASASNLPFGTFPFPAMAPTERYLELSPDQSQRILPPPVMSQQSGHQHVLRSASQAESTQRRETGSADPWARDPSTTPLDSSESAAINTLAGLASTGSRLESTRPPYHGSGSSGSSGP